MSDSLQPYPLGSKKAGVSEESESQDIKYLALEAKASVQVETGMRKRYDINLFAIESSQWLLHPNQEEQ